MVPDIARSGHSFKGAMAYYLHDKRQGDGPQLATAERVAWTESRNLAVMTPETAARVMIATAKQADELKAAAGVKNTGRKSNAHVYAYSLAWHPDEAGKLERAEMVRAVDSSLKALGAEQHQAVIVCHRDQKHPHVHVIVNRVHPETGRMLSTSNDRLKLSDWANAYERERGQIMTPKREEKRQTREAFRAAAQPTGPKQAPTAPQKPVQREKVKSDAAALKELSDAQKARHKAEWPALSEKNKADRSAIFAGYSARIKTATVAHRQVSRPYWSQHFKAARGEERAFLSREQHFAGIIKNALDAARHQQSRGQAPATGSLSMVFQNVLSSTARAAAFAERQELGRAALASSLKSVLDVEITGLKQQRTAALAAQRKTFAEARASLIERQDRERAKMREAWRQVYERRGKDPQYVAARARKEALGRKAAWETQRAAVKAERAERPAPVLHSHREALTPAQVEQLKARADARQQARALARQQEATPQPEPKPMAKDPRDEFGKAVIPDYRVTYGKQEQRFTSHPAPAPSPAGGPPVRDRKVQDVPQAKTGPDWTPPKAAPAPRKDWSASATPAAPAPSQARKDWSAATPSVPREIKPLPPRDKSKDYDRER